MADDGQVSVMMAMMAENTSSDSCPPWVCEIDCCLHAKVAKVPKMLKIPAPPVLMVDWQVREGEDAARGKSKAILQLWRATLT